MGWRQTSFGACTVGLALTCLGAIPSCDSPNDTLVDGGPPPAPSASASDATTAPPSPNDRDARAEDTSAPPSSLARPPPNVGAPTASTAKHAFALRVLFLGDTNRASVASPDAWKSLGYDLDGLASSATSSDHCALRDGADPRVRLDGAMGIDNAFGAHVLPVIAALDPALSRTTNEVLAAGRGNTLVEVTGLDLDPSQTASGLSARSFDAAARTNRPAWNGSDDLSVLPASLVDGATLASGAKGTFREAYVNQGVVVARAGSLRVRLPIGGGTLALTIRNATISFRKPKTGFDTAEGTLAGTLDVDELLGHLRDEAGRFSTTLCEGTRYDDLAESVRRAADMLRDGTNRELATCDAISIGLGFVATELRPLTNVANDPAPPADPCQ